jgi:hypothetical protein
MKPSEIKKLLIGSLSADAVPEEVSRHLDDENISYDFSEGFTDKVINKLFAASMAVSREVEFVKSMNYVFYRIAFTGIAAIVVLLISIFLMQGSISFNSFLGLSDANDESIICLLTGN